MITSHYGAQKEKANILSLKVENTTMVPKGIFPLIREKIYFSLPLHFAKMAGE